MPQYVQHGPDVIEFPDGMSDNQMAQAIRGSASLTASPEPKSARSTISSAPVNKDPRSGAMQRVEFEGKVHEFPSDFSDADIATALKSLGSAKTSAIASPQSATPQLDVTGRIKEHLTREPAPGDRSLFGEPEILAPVGKAIRAVGRFALPSSNTGAGVMAGVAAAPALPGLAALSAFPALARIVGGTAGGAIGGATEGEGAYGAGKGAVEGALSSVFGEGLSKAFSKIARSTEWGRRLVNARDARRVGNAVDEVAPTLKPGTTAGELQRTAEGQGLDRIGQAKENMTQAIESKLSGGAPSRFKDVGTPPAGTAEPGEYLASARAAAEASPFTSALPPLHIDVPSLGKSVSLRDANNELSSIGDMMRGIKPLDPRFPKDADLKQEYGRLANEIRDGIRSVAGPDAAAQWAKGQADYRAGRFIGDDLLGRRGLFRQGEFTAKELQDWLRTPENRAELAKALGGNLRTGENLGAYNKLVDAITRGAEPGMVDQLAGQAPGFFSGKGSYGALRAPMQLIHALLPNASTKYVGRQPLQLPAPLQRVLDAVGVRGAEQVQ